MSPSTPTLSPAEIERIRLALMRVARKIRVTTDESVTQSQLAVMATLHEHGPSTVGQIARYEKVKAPSASRIVSSLESRGFIERTPNPTDSRSHTVSLTPSAVKFLEQQMSPEDDWLTAHLALLSARELKAVQSAVPAIEKMVELSPEFWPPGVQW